MSKLSTWLHAHATVVDDAATLIGGLLAVAPLPPVVKTGIAGVVTEMKGTADNLHKSAAQVEQDLLADLLAGIDLQTTAPAANGAVAVPTVQQAASALAGSVQQMTQHVTAAVSPPAATAGPILTPAVPQNPTAAGATDPFARFRSNP